jgi:hypothetical protein
MPRHTEASEELFRDSVTTLTRLAQNDGYAVRERRGQAQLLGVDGPRRATINVRTDAQDGGWWGFTKNVEADLKKEGQKWFLVLLESTPGKGYMLSDVEVSSAKTRWDDGGRQYIVHPAKLRDLWRFRGVEQVWSRVKSRM